ncbi:MAG: ATP-binding protein [Phycisphaerales bacterium]
MIIIHGVNTVDLPRLVAKSLLDRLKVMPVVVVTGARQTGKSTLVQTQLPRERRYFSLDDIDVHDVAVRDPASLLGGALPVTLDEIQRVPSLLHAVKRSIDRHRVAGQFLLTGSANLLLMRRVSESLAGRASYLTLWPMTRREQRGLARCGLWDELLSAPDEAWMEVLSAQHDEPEDWRALARRGGFPTPALHLSSDADRAVWFDGYVRTYLERDLQALSAISALSDFRRLMRAACLRIGQLVNQAELGRDVALAQPTVHRYLNLLETSYLLVRVPAYSVNRTKRLIKTPKMYWGDTGVAAFLAGGVLGDSPGGAYLENLVIADLLAWRDARVDRADVFYWRTTTGDEVDIVVETDKCLLPIEIKASPRPRLADAAHLRTFRQEYGKRARAGILLHAGTTTEWLAPDVLAAPWWRVV